MRKSLAKLTLMVTVFIVQGTLLSEFTYSQVGDNKRSYRPGVVDKQHNPIDLEEMDTFLYGGMYARAAIAAFAYDTKGNKGISFGLNAIQIVKDGEPLGSRVSA